MYGQPLVLTLALWIAQAALTLLLGIYLGRRGYGGAPHVEDGEADPSRQVMAIATQLRQVSSDVLRGVHQLHTRVEEFDRHIQAVDPRADLTQIQTLLATEVSRMVEGNENLQTELKTARLQIEKQATELADYRRQSRTDPLTGAMNRRGLGEELAYLLSLSRRYGDKFGVLMIDLDDFKQVNDIHGHLAGDKLLRGVAQLLIRLVRETDVVGRQGGDEFVVLLPHCDVASVGMAAERARQAIETAAFHCNELELVGVRISVGGTAVLPGDTEESLLRRADTALLRAKATSRAQVHDGHTIAPISRELVNFEASVDAERKSNSPSASAAHTG